MKKCTVKSSIVLSRNIDRYPFPTSLTFDASEIVLQEMVQTIQSIEGQGSCAFLVGMNEEEKENLYYQGQITYNMVRNTIHSGVVQGLNNKFYRLNDENHLSIVSESYTETLRDLWTEVLAVEQKLAPKMNFAFDLKLGYLTSRITNIGTGLKLSVLIHLPGIVRTGYIQKLIQTVHQIGFSLKEYSVDEGVHLKNYFELSNDITIGKTELELIEGLEELIDKIEKKEEDALETLLSAQDKVLEDELYRAYGLLKNARLISYEEGTELLSKVRLGITLGFFKRTTVEVVDELIFAIHPQLIEGRQVLLGRKGDSIRAEYIRAHFG